jgi:nitroreductase
MHTDSPPTRDVYAVSDGLAEAAAAAGYAPSIHHTQPWRWRISSDTLDLYLQRDRLLAVTDPDTRQATVSCGAALHHARTVLSAEGWHVTVKRMPDAADQDHLAQLRAYAPAPADPLAVRHVRTIPLRHTNRRPVIGAPVDGEDLRDINASVQAEGAWLKILKPDQVIELAAAADHAQQLGAGEPEWRTELAYWTAAHRPAGQPGDLPISVEHDRSALFAILYGRSDEPRDWLRAGEALSAAWLTATERGVSVMPLSAPVEVIGTRETMRRLLSYLDHPYLVLRFGTAEPAGADAPDAPRLPADQTIERL